MLLIKESRAYMESNKCIYCNSTDLTISDIIPSALTHKKITRKNVCRKHNALINKSAENEIIKRLQYLRNHFSITSRNGSAEISYTISLYINDIEYTFDKFISLPDAVRDGIEGIRVSDGKKVKFGKIDDNGNKEDIVILDNTIRLSSLIKINLKFLCSLSMLRLVAKIGFKWFCYVYHINGYDQDYNDIINYIMREDPTSTIDSSIVQIITDEQFYQRFNQISETGTHILSITHEKTVKYMLYSYYGALLVIK